MLQYHRLILTCLICIVGKYAVADESIIADAADGPLRFQSIQSIGFAPEGVLLVGDGIAGQIVAIETSGVEQKAFTGPIRDIEKTIAGRIGTTPERIRLIDLAVNPATRAVFMAINRVGERHKMILVVSGKDDIKEFALDDARYASAKLSTENLRLADVAWADGQIIATGSNTDAFASKIVSITTPLKHGVSTESASAETYHVAHSRWETKAPMHVVVPFTEDGRQYIVGAFRCTPIVKYPLDALRPGAKVKGMSVLELGSGNQPIDMFLYEKDGKQFVLANTFRRQHSSSPFGPTPYWTVKFERAILSETQDINQKALRRVDSANRPLTDRVQMIDAFHGVMQMDKLDDAHTVVLRQTEKSVDLETLPLP